MGAQTNVQQNKISYELTELTPDTFREKGVTSIGEMVDGHTEQIAALGVSVTDHEERITELENASSGG